MTKIDLLWLLLLLVLAVCPSQIYRYKEYRAQSDLHTCHANLKNLATACEMYSTDNAGRYPIGLGKLPSEYLEAAHLKSIPVCPGADSTASGYHFISATNPDAFSICCSGFNHRPKIMTANYPQYFSTSGILER